MKWKSLLSQSCYIVNTSNLITNFASEEIKYNEVIRMFHMQRQKMMFSLMELM